MNFLTEPEISKEEAELQRVLSKAETLYSSQEYDELVTFLKQNANLQNDEVLWRLARALTDKSKITDDKTEKKKLVFEAFDVIKQALALNDNNFACHKVRNRHVCKAQFSLFTDTDIQTDFFSSSRLNHMKIPDNFVMSSNSLC